ncbi:hypothetical protein EES44_30535 [Streptomyces sp. ADI96-15]|nr:hypothetical protein EES44_30535 [Streptomyces sp. ADI96-15]
MGLRAAGDLGAQQGGEYVGGESTAVAGCVGAVVAVGALCGGGRVRLPRVRLRPVVLRRGVGDQPVGVEGAGLGLHQVDGAGVGPQLGHVAHAAQGPGRVEDDGGDAHAHGVVGEDAAEDALARPEGADDGGEAGALALLLGHPRVPHDGASGGAGGVAEVGAGAVAHGGGDGGQGPAQGADRHAPRVAGRGGRLAGDALPGEGPLGGGALPGDRAAVQVPQQGDAVAQALGVGGGDGDADPGAGAGRQAADAVGQLVADDLAGLVLAGQGERGRLAVLAVVGDLRGHGVQAAADLVGGVLVLADLHPRRHLHRVGQLVEALEPGAPGAGDVGQGGAAHGQHGDQPADGLLLAQAGNGQVGGVGGGGPPGVVGPGGEVVRVPHGGVGGADAEGGGQAQSDGPGEQPVEVGGGGGGGVHARPGHDPADLRHGLPHTGQRALDAARAQAAGRLRERADPADGHPVHHHLVVQRQAADAALLGEEVVLPAGEGVVGGGVECGGPAAHGVGAVGDAQVDGAAA